MTKFSSRKTATAIALALALGLFAPVTTSLAAGNGWFPGMGWMMGQGGMMGQQRGGWGRGMMGYDADDMLDRIDGRLAFMKAELKITENQKEAWDTFAEAVKSTAETRNDMMRSAMDDMQSGAFFDKPLPDRLILQETHMEARLEEIRTVKAAVEKLYAVLSEDQKEVADDIVLPTMGMGMGRMRGGMGPG
ncbi:MAG: Spy/CpxP family protein refolding chaperone, partial [Nitratireductor sp.]|nr:Spy/CpxP family protein refolding chaperone [Nitratireductor sp.]